jgi:Flp pilus assembly protein TadB
MSLSAREKRILSAIEDDLAAAEPRLASALGSMRRPAWRHPGYGWLTLMASGALAGLGTLLAGLMLGAASLVVTGAVLIQLAPVIVAWLLASAARRQRRSGTGVTRQRA